MTDNQKQVLHKILTNLNTNLRSLDAIVSVRAFCKIVNKINT